MKNTGIFDFVSYHFPPSHLARSLDVFLSRFHFDFGSSTYIRTSYTVSIFTYTICNRKNRTFCVFNFQHRTATIVRYNRLFIILVCELGRCNKGCEIVVRIGLFFFVVHLCAVSVYIYGFEYPRISRESCEVPCFDVPSRLSR